MDGLNNTTGSKKNFVQTYMGKFAVKADPNDPDATTRTNKKGRVVHEKYYDTITGYLIGWEKYESKEYDDSWNLEFLSEKGTPITLNILYSGGATMGVIRRLPNLDCSKIMRLKIYWFEAEADKDAHAAMTVQQQNEQGAWYTLDKYWSKEEPKGLPDLEQKVINNKTIWDSTVRMMYIETYFKERFFPRLAKDSSMVKEALNYSGAQASTDNLPDDEPEPNTAAPASTNQAPEIPATDDLPF